MNLSIHPVDSTIVLGYMLVVLARGLWIGRGQRTSTDYFLAGRSLPWWALLLSIVATETSTVTFLSIPGMAFAKMGGDLRFLQITFGYIVGRIFVVYMLLPLFFRGQPFTAYEVLETRFGKTTRRAASLLFLVTRNLSDALRLFLTALVLQTVLGLDLALCVVLLGAVTILYTVLGGAKSVIWNDCIQFIIYMLGAAAAGVVIVRSLPGGMEQMLLFAEGHDKLRLFDWEFNLAKQSMTFWAGLVGGAFLTTATHGTDQLMVQRYLAASSRSAAGRALALSGLVVCLQFAIFLMIGVGLACFFDLFPPTNPFAKNDQVFAHFIVHHMPIGLTGFTLAAVFAAAMSTLSSSLNSSATTLVRDLVVPLRRHALSGRQELRLGRMTTVFFGFVQIGIAIVSGQIGANQSTVMKVLAIAGFATGPVLGLYFLAIVSRRTCQFAALIGFAIGLVVLFFLRPLVWWPWYAAIGSLVTLVAGWAVGAVMDGDGDGGLGAESEE